MVMKQAPEQGDWRLTMHKTMSCHISIDDSLEFSYRYMMVTMMNIVIDDDHWPLGFNEIYPENMKFKIS